MYAAGLSLDLRTEALRTEVVRTWLVIPDLSPFS